MEGLFVGATLGVIVPIYIGAIINISMYIYEFGCDIKKYFLYKKVKLDFQFDTVLLAYAVFNPSTSSI